ncbi:hypothetical protein A9G34_00245 [Gilliamella sp. Choc4-2]|jgi:benzil reductase ((S)-benzoin forming)|uniref:SDR family NAD(P)-dependent oxidoreductase n=1 Tax=unclassified Gilliamella TaxID=2685620 RepID=UPI0004DD149D|nr:SDR family NAD(P)-dependent oxidoreductase [Gilliamella apicola]KFA59212.1 hypothetical protein GAPWKB11_1101 [Gilliamella apicola]OCG30167.1 hypothetical protein A9G33_08690 [Gilliamella apicola]OCG47449.1 hypothetical protein A9G34_00245 [Gilliamella apicola]OCG55046.1 hypothetical protein A9G36_06835 [Gilliamella apicola]OCG62553.1 hypothetical protein A9G48_08115 [Gilliamella apicola]
MKKNIFISGVSSGIGRELALYHLKEGDSVYGISRSKCAELEKYQHFHHHCIDLSQSEFIVSHLKEFSNLKQIKKIDRLYLNAGLFNKVTRLDQLSFDDFNYVMSVNLFSYKILLDFFLNHDQLSLEQIIISSSIAGVRPRQGMSVYAVSKAALNMMIKIYALENPHLFFAVIGLCIFDSAVSRVITLDNPKLNEFPELKKLAERLSKNDGYLVSSQQRAKELIHVLNNIETLQITSGDFFEIRDLLH